MSITVERRIDDETPEEFLEVYRAAFAPLEALAAARQSLTDDEFREEMTDESVLKFVCQNRDGITVALSFVATDLSAVPWISPVYFAERFPEHYERHAIWYFGALLVLPEHQGGPWVNALLEEMVTAVVANDGIAAFDCCAFNVTEMGVPDFVEAATRRVAEVDCIEIDVQRYYAYVARGFHNVIDLRPETRDALERLAR